MKTWDEIDIEKVLIFEDFVTLFERLPLNEKEKKELYDYFQIYEIFLDADVSPKESWTATKNIFIMKNSEIATRI
jgi:hypothetical protein